MHARSVRTGKQREYFIGAALLYGLRTIAGKKLISPRRFRAPVQGKMQEWRGTTARSRKTRSRTELKGSLELKMTVIIITPSRAGALL